MRVAQPSLTDMGTRRAIFTQGFAAHQAALFDETLAKIDSAIRSVLVDHDLSGLNRRTLEALLAALAATLTGVLVAYTAALQASVIEYANNEADFTARMVDGDAPADEEIRDAVLNTPLSLAGTAKGSLLAAYLAKWALGETEALIGTLRLGAFQDKNNQVILKAVRGSESLGYTDGLFAQTAKHAKTVAATAVVHGSAVARNEVYAANPEIATHYRWVSILDAKTCVVCSALSEQVFMVGKGPLPQIHSACRCHTVPVVPEDEGADRRSYYQWLKSQPDDFIDFALGPSRAKLFRDGGLSSERFSALMLDRNFKPLTLEEIKRLDPLAFKRAGL